MFASITYSVPDGGYRRDVLTVDPMIAVDSQVQPFDAPLQTGSRSLTDGRQTAFNQGGHCNLERGF